MRRQAVAEWTETYRGVVNAWECDVVEHFTIAYYFDRFPDATRNFFDLIGAADHLRTGAGAAPARWHATFQSELRAGTSFHIVTGVLEAHEKTLCLGHQLLDSTTGKVSTLISETVTVGSPLPPALLHKLDSLKVAWPGPKLPDRADPRSGGGMLSARDRVKSWEIGEDGFMALPSYIHRFSGAMMQALTAVGFTGAYMSDNRRGFSTFELDLKVSAGAKAGEMLDCRTAVAQLGNSSMRFIHRMTDKSGREIATLSQAGVHLDLDARKSTAIPADIRAKIEKLMVED